jgi:hypothetical protein
MSEAWFILTKRFGADVPDPSSDDLRAAVGEVVDPEHASDSEHTNTLVRYGHDDGPMYVLSYDADRCLTFEQWADQEFESELAPAGYRRDVPPAEALRLMEALRTGAVARVKQEAWAAGR